MSCSRAVLQQSIAKILKGADLNHLTAKKVRQQLESELGEDLTHRKKEIDDLMMELITKAAELDKVDQPKSVGDAEASESEPSDSESDSGSDLNDPPPKKKKTDSGRTSKPGHVQRSDSCEDDEALARQLQDEENTSSSRSTRRNRSAKPAKSNKSKDRTPKRKERAQGQSHYSKPCLLSPELAAVMGTNQMARKDVVKTIWSIIKERNLQDPANKQYMICDEQLFPIFKVKRVKAFGMMKYLTEHMTDQR